MASIQKRGNTYRVFVSNGRDINGKQIMETITFTPDPVKTEKQNQKALEKFVYEFEQKVKDGKYLDGEKITFIQFTEKWLKEYAEHQLQPTTLAEYERLLYKNILPEIGHLRLAKIQPLQLQSFYNSLLGSRKDGKSGGYSFSSIKKHHAIISKIFNTAIEWQIVTENPCDRIKPPKPVEEKENAEFFTLEQTEQFLSLLEMDFKSKYKAHNRTDDTGKIYHVPEYEETRIISTQFKIIFYIAIYGGLRKGEILALTWNDIDFEQGFISINKTAAYVNHEIINKKPKTKSSRREVVLPMSVISLIKQHRAEQFQTILSFGDQWEGEKSRDKLDDNYLFTQWNGRQMHPHTPYHKFKDIIKYYNNTVMDESKKLPDIPFHGLRHTSATLLISQNVDIRTVSGRLGHAQTSTTMNVYAHSLKKMDEKAADTLENLIQKRKI